MRFLISLVLFSNKKKIVLFACLEKSPLERHKNPGLNLLAGCMENLW